MNERGQAMVESLLIGLIFILALSWLLKLSVYIQKKFLTDELIEDSLICLVSQNSFCTSQLRLKLAEQGYQSVFIQAQNLNHKWTLHLKAVSSFGNEIEKESELEYDPIIRL